VIRTPGVQPVINAKSIVNAAEMKDVSMTIAVMIVKDVKRTVSVVSILIPIV